MSSYQQLIFPILRRFGAERVHNRTVRALAQRMRIGRAMLKGMAGHVPKRPVEVFGLSFPDELGVAAGFDKNAEIVAGLGCLGFGHVEVGTLTPMPQAGNPRPRIFRLTEDRALINRMGFLNRGVAETFGRIRRIPHTPEGVILGVSLGKQKDTELEEAARDYLFVMEQVYP